MANYTYTVTVASGNLYGGGTGNVFYLNGARNSTGPGTVTWVNGATLRFEQSDNSNDNHPLVFSTNLNTSGIISSGVTYYLDGASNQANYTNTTTFNAATTRYVEVTPSSESDFYYLCYVHGIGMGGIFDISQSAWSASSWGFANWGTLGDTDVTVSGQSLTSQVGSTLATPSVGWGALFWGANEWGEFASPEAILTGNSLTLSLASVSAGTNFTFEATGIQIQTQQGEEVSGISMTVDLTGQVLQSTLGNEFGGELIEVPVSTATRDAWGFEAWGTGAYGIGDGITANTGTPVILASATASPTGVNATFTTPGAVAGSSVLVEPSGVSITPSLGNEFAGEVVTVEVTSPSNDEWGTEFWGAGQWGVGDGITVLLGAESIRGDANVQVSGSALSGSVGTTEIPVVIDTGIAMSPSVGSVFGGPLVQVSVSTASTLPWGEEAWGAGQYGQSVGTDISIGQDAVSVPSVDVILTGISLANSLGSVSISGTGNLSLTGQALSTQLGNEDAFTNVRINVTGNSVGTIVIGDFLAGISAEAPVTSVTATVSSGIMGINAWELVDPGTAPTWSVVDKAA